MGGFQAMLKYFAPFVTLIVCHVSILAHGIQIKPLNNQIHPSLNTNTLGHKHSTPMPILALHKTTIKYNVPASPVTPKYDVVLSEDSVIIPNDVTAFRPTTPGNSPGVGHRKFGGTMVVTIQSPDNVKVSVTEGLKNDFAPTDPGHSPGVGHPVQHKNGHN